MKYICNLLLFSNNNVINYTVRLAPEETSLELTGFGHNAVTCIGMKTDIPVKTGTVVTIGILIFIRSIQNNWLRVPIHNQIETLKKNTAVYDLTPIRH